MTKNYGLTFYWVILYKQKMLTGPCTV